MTDDKKALVLAKTKGVEAVINYYFQNKTPKEFILTRPGANGMTFKYVSIGYVISQLNIAFGFNWEWRILDQGIGKDQIWVRGELTLKDPKSDYTITRSGMGGAIIKKSRSTGEPLSIANDLKSADSDALKVAAAKFGLGADVKFKELDILEEMPDKVDTEDNGIETILMRKMFAIAADKGFSESDIDKVIKKDYGLDHKKELTKAQLQELITRMERDPDKKPTLPEMEESEEVAIENEVDMTMPKNTELQCLRSGCKNYRADNETLFCSENCKQLYASA